MREKKSGIGIGELLFGLVIVLGIIGTISFFAFGDLLGEYQTTFMIASSLAFILGFFALSVYARAKKRSYVRRVSVERALSNWIQYVGSIGSTRSAGSTGPNPHSLPAGTLESLAIHVFTTGGYRLVSGSASTGGLLRFLNQDGQLEMVHCQPGPQPLGLRDVLAFYEILHVEKGAWGEIWAPAGFTPDALNWVGKRPITLRDSADIHSIVEGLVEKREASPSRR